MRIHMYALHIPCIKIWLYVHWVLFNFTMFSYLICFKDVDLIINIMEHIKKKKPRGHTRKD